MHIMVKSAQELGQPEPRFEVGAKVRMAKPDLNGDRVGDVQGVERLYKRVYPGTDVIDPDGLVTMESMIDSIAIPHSFDGATLEVEYPEVDHGSWVQKAHAERSVFYGYGVTVYTGKMCTFINEKHVIKEYK